MTQVILWGYFYQISAGSNEVSKGHHVHL